MIMMCLTMGAVIGITLVNILSRDAVLIIMVLCGIFLLITMFCGGVYVLSHYIDSVWRIEL